MSDQRRVHRGRLLADVILLIPCTSAHSRQSTSIADVAPYHTTIYQHCHHQLIRRLTCLSASSPLTSTLSQSFNVFIGTQLCPSLDIIQPHSSWSFYRTVVLVASNSPFNTWSASSPFWSSQNIACESRFLFFEYFCLDTIHLPLFVLVPLYLKFCLSILFSTIFSNTIVQKHLF